MRIGELAKRAGVSTETIRYYEKQNLLPHPERLASGYPTYRPAQLERLCVIKVCQQNMGGITLASVALLLLFVQGGLGLQLMNALPVRRAHIAAAIATGVLIAGHVALNRIG